MSFTYPFPKADHTVDIIILRKTSKFYDEVLLIERGGEPFKGKWAIPGGFINMDETLEQSATRELKEETHVAGIIPTQFRTYGDPKRDPRGMVISTVFYAYLPPRAKVEADDDAASYKWASLGDLPELAFDHNKILKDFRKFIILKDFRKFIGQT